MLPDLPIVRLWVILCGAVLQVAGTIGAGIVAIIRFAQNSKKPSAEVHKITSEAELNEAKAESLEFRDQLDAIRMMQKFIRDGLSMEQLLRAKNETIADLEDLTFRQKQIIDDQARQIRSYEAMKLEVLGHKQLAQAQEERTGSEG